MSHYFDRAPTTASASHTVPLVLPDLTVELRTDRGVFSAERVDPGTKLLLSEAPRPPAVGDVLDVGCGYGPIAVALALRSPGSHVWAVDVNARARSLTTLNAQALNARNVTVADPASVPHATRFAAIYSNPPIRVGKVDLHVLLVHWIRRLLPGAGAYLVVHKHLGADSLARWMTTEHGWRVERLASRMGYRILQVRPSEGAHDARPGASAAGDRAGGGQSGAGGAPTGGGIAGRGGAAATSQAPS